MDRYFALLGLREDATKEQVKAAYGQRLAKYKSADYADDPAYVDRKITELNQAYAKAYERALDGSASKSAISSVPELVSSNGTVQNQHSTAEERRRQQYRVQKEAVYEKKRQAMEDAELHPLQRLSQDIREKLDRDEGEAETQGDRESSMPDLSVFRKKAVQFRDHVKQDVQEYRSEERAYAAEAEAQAAQQSPLTGNGAQPNRESSSASMGNLKAILGVLLTLAVFLFTMCDSNDEFVYEDLDGEDVIYEDSDYQTSDWDIVQMAEEATSSIWNLEFSDTAEIVKSDNEALQKAADLFAKRYTGFTSMDALCSHLYGTVGPFPAMQGSELVMQVEEVLRYYHFPQLEEVSGYINPFTDHVIDSQREYLRYLNRYYREELS